MSNDSHAADVYRSNNMPVFITRFSPVPRTEFVHMARLCVYRQLKNVHFAVLIFFQFIFRRIKSFGFLYNE